MLWFLAMSFKMCVDVLDDCLHLCELFDIALALLFHIPDMEPLLRDGVDIVYVSQGDTPRRTGRVIVVNTEFLHQLERSAEMKAAIHKRFHGKATRYTQPTFHSLVHWVLSSEEYRVRDANMTSVSDDDVTEVWEFIDTMKVSSSEGCRLMLEPMIRSRDRESFRRTIGYPKTPPRPRVKGMKVPRTAPIMLRVGDELQGVHDTIDGAILEDAVHMTATSSDPVGACRSISSSIRGWH